MGAEVKVEFLSREFIWREYDKKSLPKFWTSIINALEYRYEWFQYNEYVEDPYESYYGRNV